MPPLAAGIALAMTGGMHTIKRLGAILPLATVLFCNPGKSATPARLDIAVVSVEVTPAPAGQPSEARVTVANRGTETLYPQDYLVEIKAPGTPEEMRRNACGTQRVHVFIDPPEEIEPGQMEVITVHHIFARAGSYPMTVQATLARPEDGSHADDALTITRNVPESPCTGNHVASR
jgi:hypothetical protein